MWAKLWDLGLTPVLSTSCGQFTVKSNICLRLEGDVTQKPQNVLRQVNDINEINTVAILDLYKMDSSTNFRSILAEFITNKYTVHSYLTRRWQIFKETPPAASPVCFVTK